MTKIILSKLRIYYPEDENSKYMAQVEYDIVCEAMRYSMPGMDAADLAQELRYAVWKSIARYDETKSGFRTWGLIQIKNKIKELLRNSKRHKRIIHYHTEPLDDK